MANKVDAKGIIATVLGVVALAAFGGFSYYLAKSIGEQQQQWDRLVYIFGGVEAVAFAAAGYLFGKEVNRARAESAEDKANDAEKTAREGEGSKSKAEAKLDSLVKYIDIHAPQAGTPSAVLADLLNLGRRPGIGDRAPELMAAIEAEHAAPTPDSRWDALARFAKSLNSN